MNNEYYKDIAKGIKRTPLDQELQPGVTPRRYEPTGGINKHNDRIHRESEVADGKGLDFNFSKPYKAMGRKAYVSCDSCGYITAASTITYGMICPECKQFSTVTEVVDE